MIFLLSGFLAKAKEKAETVGHKIQSKMDGTGLAGSTSSPILTQPTSSRYAKRPDYISVQVKLI